MVLREILAQADEVRIGRAVAGLIAGVYRFEPKNVQMDGTVRGYVQGLEQGEVVTDYAVYVGESGKSWCSCPDCFIAGNICKHVIVAALTLCGERAQEYLEQRAAGRQAAGSGKVRQLKRAQAGA